MARKKTATCQSCGGPRWDNPNSQTGMCRPCSIEYRRTARLCEVPGCDRPHLAKSMCHYHYYNPPEALGDPGTPESPHEAREVAGDPTGARDDTLLPRRAPRDAAKVWRCGCPKTPENTYLPPNPTPGYHGQCWECRKATKRAWKARGGGSRPVAEVWRCGHPRVEGDVQCPECLRQRERHRYDLKAARRVELAEG